MPLQSLLRGFSSTGKKDSTRSNKVSNQCKNVGGLLNKNKRKHTKRGRGKKNEQTMNIFSTNAAGLKNKIQSFKNEIKHLNAGIFTIQETHFNKKGKFKLEGFEIFEAIRNKQKGGTMIGAHKALNPMLIKEYED